MKVAQFRSIRSDDYIAQHRRTSEFAFALFIAWIIYLANTGQNSVFSEFVKAIPDGDKLGHVMLFGLLTLGMNIATRFKRVDLRSCQPLVGTAAVTAFVLVEEFSQCFVPERTLDAMDLAADALGIVMFTGISLRIGNANENVQHAE